MILNSRELFMGIFLNGLLGFCVIVPLSFILMREDIYTWVLFQNCKHYR